MNATKQQLIEQTAQFLRKKGYFGTGLREILDKTGVPKGSLYHFFPKGKSELAIEALHFSGDIMLNKFRMAMKGKDATEALTGNIDVLMNELVESRYQYGCPLATVCLEISQQEEEISWACSDIYKSWETRLVEFLRSRGIDDPEYKASMFLVLLEGAYVMAKARKDITYFNNIKLQIPILLNANIN